MDNNLGNKETMARNIRYYMELNEKTRSDLSKDLNVKYTTLTDWINAKTYPRIDKIELMAEYFGITKADLVEEHQDLVSFLNPEEKMLLENFRRLSRQNKDRAIRILSGMCDSQEGDEILRRIEEKERHETA